MEMVLLYSLLLNCCLTPLVRGQAGYHYENTQPIPGDLSPAHTFLKSAASSPNPYGQTVVYQTSFYGEKWKTWSTPGLAGQENPQAAHSQPGLRYLPPQQTGPGREQSAQQTQARNAAEAQYRQPQAFQENIFNTAPAPNRREVPAAGLQSSQLSFGAATVDTRMTDEVNANAEPIFDNTRFANGLNSLIAQNNANVNTVVSPISLQTILALVYIGAGGSTAKQLQEGLGLSPNKSLVGTQFRRLVDRSAAVYTDPNRVRLQTANKMYYANDVTINAHYERNAIRNFHIETERINFGQPNVEAKINAWVSRKTQQLINNVIQPQSLGADTAAILVNAISFKAKWAQEFSTDDTRDDTFHVNSLTRVPVRMMSNEERYRYALLDGAQVVDLPFKDSDMSMLVVLPNERDGLASVEEQMRNFDLRGLPELMGSELVNLQLPRFRVEFELDMVGALRQLGIYNIFTDQAELGDVLSGRPMLGISKVQHKAYIEVNEAGVKAAAASFSKFVPLSLPSNVKNFKANHPFMFAIRSPQAVYFIGHMVNP